jgi:hypothetical protein
LFLLVEDPQILPLAVRAEEEEWELIIQTLEDLVQLDRVTGEMVVAELETTPTAQAAAVVQDKMEEGLPL